MVDADDDFDDLYGDLNCNMKAYSNGIEAKISDFGTFGNERVDLEDEKVIDYSESDEDDDFRILLNGSRNGGFGDKKTILSENDGVSNGSGPEIAHAGSNLEGYPVSCRATTFERDVSSDQNGDNFRLPRHRNIFDINIEAFNHRPWSHHGADVTDYFNFGMDENSWKSYWELVNHHKNQACMSNRQSVYQTSLTNERGSKSSSKESSDTEGRRLDMDHLPKGRAIEVRCGFGERISSIDMWRPMRSQDPDVVIPIIMETSEDNELASYKNGMEHAEVHMCTSPSTSKIYSNERTSSPHSNCQIQRNVIKSIERCSPEQSKILSRISDKFELNVTCTKDKEGHPEKNSSMVEGIPGYQARVQCSSNSYNTESHSDDSKEILCTKEKNKVVKVTSMKKVQGNVVSDYSTSENIVSDPAESEQEASKNNSDEHDFSSHNQSLPNERRLKSVAEINKAKDEFDSLDRMKRKRNTSSCNNRNSNCEFEPNYRSRIHTVKRHRDKYWVHHLQNHDHREKSSAIELQRHNHHRNLDGKYCFKQKEHELTERCHRNRFADDFSEQRENEFFKRHHIIWDEKEWNTEHDFPERHHHRNWERQHHRFRDKEDGLYHREFDLSERRHFEKWDNGYSSNIETDYSERRFEERDGRSLIYKYSDRLKFKNDLFREKDLPLHMLDEKKDWVRMDAECVKIANHTRFIDRDSQAMDRRQTHCMGIAENFDIKFSRPDYRVQREISPGISRFDERIKCGNRFEQIDDENANYMFDSHGSNDERMHYCSPPRDHVHTRLSSRSNRRHVNHVDHCDIRDVHVKETRNAFIVQNINHHHHFSYEDNLESDIDGDFPEENVCHENFVSHIGMRRLGQLSKSSLYPQQGVLPSHERFVSQKSLERSDLQVKKPLSLRQRLNFDHKLNNVKKFKVEAWNPVNVDQSRSKHKVAVNNHLNGFKGKLATKCNGVATESKEVIANCKIETLPKKFMHIRKIEKQDETSVSNGKCNSKLGITEDHEVEEGELIEGSRKKNMKTAIKNADVQPKDSSQSVKVVGIYNNSRILETLKKMEKRKERFKESIAPKQEPVKNSNAQVDVSVAAESSSNPQTTEVKEQRPVRKRKWRGN